MIDESRLLFNRGYDLTAHNTQYINVYVSFQLQERKDEKEHLCSALRTKIHELWDRLQSPQEEKEALSEHMTKSKKKNIEAVRNLEVNL